MPVCENVVILLDSDSAQLLHLSLSPPPHSDIKPHFSNPPNERIWSKSIVSSLKIGMKGKAASQMREREESPMMRGRGEETGRHTVHKIRRNKIYTVRERKLRRRK